MAAIGVGLESYRDLVSRLERAEQDDFDRELLGCLRSLDEQHYQTLLNRARAIVATIKERMRKGPDGVQREIIERYRDDCDRVVLSYLILAQGVGEDNLFRYVTFAGF